MQKFVNKFIDAENSESFQEEINNVYINQGWKILNLIDTPIPNSEKIFVQMLLEKEEMSKEELIDLIQKSQFSQSANNLAKTPTLSDLGASVGSNQAILQSLLAGIGK